MNGHFTLLRSTSICEICGNKSDIKLVTDTYGQEGMCFSSGTSCASVAKASNLIKYFFFCLFLDGS